jgi:hypothetical protein
VRGTAKLSGEHNGEMKDQFFGDELLFGAQPDGSDGDRIQVGVATVVDTFEVRRESPDGAGRRAHRRLSKGRRGPVRYHEVLETLRCDEGVCTADIHQDWMQGRTIFGGLQVALAVRAMRNVIGPAQQLRSLQATFVAPLPAGRIELRPDVLRTGRSATVIATCSSATALWPARSWPSSAPPGRQASREIKAGRLVAPEALDDMRLSGSHALVPAAHAGALGQGTALHRLPRRTIIYPRVREPGCPGAVIALRRHRRRCCRCCVSRRASSSTGRWSCLRSGTFDVTGWSLIDAGARRHRRLPEPDVSAVGTQWPHVLREPPDRRDIA